jgi:hypothetical protein
LKKSKPINYSEMRKRSTESARMGNFIVCGGRDTSTDLLVKERYPSFEKKVIR